MKSLADALAEEWRLEAERLRRRGADGFARLLESCAEDLEVAQTEWELEELSVPQAAQEIGKSKSQIFRYIQAGRLEKTSPKGRIRVRRADVIALHPSEHP